MMGYVVAQCNNVNWIYGCRLFISRFSRQVVTPYMVVGYLRCDLDCVNTFLVKSVPV